MFERLNAALKGRYRTHEPRRVTELRRTVLSQVDTALAKSLEKQPAGRFKSPEAFAAALENGRIIGAKSVSALLYYDRFGC